MINQQHTPSFHRAAFDRLVREYDTVRFMQQRKTQPAEADGQPSVGEDD